MAPSGDFWAAEIEAKRLENGHVVVDRSDNVYTISDKIIAGKQFACKEVNFVDRPAPRDPFNLIYIMLFMIGILLLLPFNFFTTANDYWMYKFRNTSLTKCDSDQRTWRQIEFASWLTIISQTTSVVFLFIVTMLGYKIKAKTSVIFSISAVLLLFILMAAFIQVDTDTWQDEFFIITMLTVAGINAMKSFFNVSIYALISRFPTNYLIPYLIGQGFAGIFSAMLQIVALALSASSETTALIYFWCGISFIALTLILFIVSGYTDFYKFYMAGFKEGKRKKIMTIREFYEICKSIWSSVVIMGIIILTMIPVYPAVASLVVSEGAVDNAWTKSYFVPVSTYLIYCVSEVIGRFIASIFKKTFSERILVVITTIRLFLYIPAIMLCNARPRHGLPVWFSHDWEYMIIIATFGGTCGYLANITYTNVEKLVPEDKKMEAYSVLSTANGIVLALGSLLSPVCVQLL